MNLSDTSMKDIEQGKLIEFGDDLNNMLPVNKEHYYKTKMFQKCSFIIYEGNQFPKYEILAHGNSDEEVKNDTPLPIFSVINFDTTRCVVVHH